jgi:hypothetical protein
MAMDSSSTYLFEGLIEGQMKKMLGADKEIPMKKGQQIIKEGQPANGWRRQSLHPDRTEPRVGVTP